MKNRSSRLLPSVVLALVVAATFAASSAAAQTKAPARKIEPTKPQSTATSPTDPAAPSTPENDDPNTEETRAVYLTADFGFTRPDIGGFKNSLAFDKTAANGILAGLGVGYRHKALRFGFRFRDQDTTQFTLWSLMGEVGYGINIKPITPVILLHAGYMFDNGIERSVFASQLPPTNILTPNVNVKGLVLGVEAFGAIPITKFLKVGPFLGFDMTFLHRPQPSPPQSTQPLSTDTTNNALFGGSGSGVGYVLNIGVRVVGDVGF